MLHFMMNIYRDLAFPLFKLMDPEEAHERMARSLEFAGNNAAGKRALNLLAGKRPERPIKLMGLRFPNPVGVAAGFDKSVRLAPGLAELGFGHIEVGTLTPKPQEGNARPRIFRLPEKGALLNRMGFPNPGLEDVMPRLKALHRKPRNWVLGVSIGKQKETPLAEALKDYTRCFQAVAPFSDYVAVNISSPNTPGLRELQGGAFIEGLLRGLKSEARTIAEENNQRPTPIAVKIAPDVRSKELDEMLEAIVASGVDGLIVGNTTVSRAGFKEPWTNEAGGISGRPLTHRSTKLIAEIHKRLGGQELPIIGVGGVFTATDAQEKLDAGASLVQLYTGLVYEGPGIAGKILRGLAS
ncbi:MAG: quinone-dependent dihydroorotate dehydrogenase [Sumerlaeia bacterium]